MLQHHKNEGVGKRRKSSEVLDFAFYEWFVIFRLHPLFRLVTGIQ
jgi:hypothetical protein